VLWTGDSVISKTISAGSLGPVSKLFHGNVCIWDNIYANDYCPWRLFIGPYKNRGDLRKATRGILLNPTGLAHTDMFLLSLLSGYARGVGPEAVWKSVIADFPVAKELRTVAPFFSLPHMALPKTALSPKNIARVKAALKKLIWEWKSPLQREWYPFLYSLGSDITLMESAAGEKRSAWIRKKYPPVLADILDNQLQ
jgi:protein O-GlcNAcase/histone acetyltransferase